MLAPDERNAVRDRDELLRSDLRALLHLPSMGVRAADTTSHRLPAYCGWIESGRRLALTKTAEARDSRTADGRCSAGGQSDPGTSAGVG